MREPAVTLEWDETVALVRLARPDARNAIDAEGHRELCEIVDRLHRSSDTRAAVVLAEGSAFSAGGDFTFIEQGNADIRFLLAAIDEGRQFLAQLIDLPFPTIAAVQGPAVGLGATLALACDMVVAARTAWFADPHVVVGLAAGDGGCLVWPDAVGVHRAKRYLLTGDRMTAEEAYQFGVVTDLVDQPHEVHGAALALAARIAALPPLAVQGTKRAVGNLTRSRSAEVADLAFAYQARTVLSDDVLLAVAAQRDGVTHTYQGR